MDLLEETPQLPTEMLIKIFKYISGKELFACTKVCKQWRNVIKDTYEANNYKWQLSIMNDFNMDKEDVKTVRNMSLYNVYYNLSKWPNVGTASVRIREIYRGNEVEYMKGFLLLRDGLIAVHKNTEIFYYNIHNGTVDERPTLRGTYKQYYENDYTVVTLGENNNLNLIRKSVFAAKGYKTYEYPYTKYFTVTNEKLYYVTYENTVYVCDLDEDYIISDHIGSYDIEMMTLKYKQNLYIMTNYLEVICCDDDNQTTTIIDPLQDYNPQDEYAALNKLYKLGILDFMNCNLYKKTLYLTKSQNNYMKTHEVSVLFATAKVVFVGNIFGILQVYHFPDEINFGNSKPLKEWDLSYSSRRNECPIIQIGVLENASSHVIIVALPLKLVAIELSQEFDYIYQ